MSTHRVARAQGSRGAAQAALRKPRSNGALCATSMVPRANSRNAGSTDSILGAATTMLSVMPVSTEMNGGIGEPGSTRVGELAEHLAAPDLDRPDLGDRVLARRDAGGLQVEHDEGDLAERHAQLVQRSLYGVLHSS